MKNYLKNILKNHLSKQEMTIYSRNNSIIFKLKNSIPFFKKNLIIKNRKTGKRISKKIKNKKTELFKDEIKDLFELININESDNLIKNIDKDEIFDIFLKYKFFNFEYLKRAPSPVPDKDITLASEENKAILKKYTTIESNLSFLLIKSLFNQTIENIETLDNYLLLEGSLNLFKNLEFDELEICAQNKETFEKRYFKCSYNKNQKIINFKAKIDFKVNADDIDSFWKLSIRLKNKDLIIAEAFLDGSLLNKITSYEKRRLLIKTDTLYIDKVENPLNIAVSLYLIKNYLRLRVSTKKKWLELYNNSKNKNLYEKYCKKEILDKRKIFFESFHGKSYSHNPKYIYEKMLQMRYDKIYDFVWSYEGKLKIPGNPIIVNRNCEKYYELLASSKYLVNNISFPVKKKRKGAVYIQTTHGTPLKHMGEDIKNDSSKIIKGNITSEAKKWDYLISPNQYSHDIFKRAFLFKKEILDKGYPANDIFYEKINKKRNEIKKALNINPEKKIILYAPTFRDTERDINGNPYFDLPLDLNKFYDEFNDKYIILLRFHYLISNNIKIEDKLKKFVLDVSNYDDVHELLLVSDILITDYSSVFFDYAHSKNPILFFMPDFKIYKENIRGLYLDIKKDLPGPIFFNENELVNGIKNISKIKKRFEYRYGEFYNKYCELGHGNSSEEVIKSVFEGENDSKL